MFCRVSATRVLRVFVRLTRVMQGNHVLLAEEGVIPALIDLAKTECQVVRRNCASALRSMTCKACVRELLIASGAIKVILDDATNQVRCGAVRAEMKGTNTTGIRGVVCSIAVTK